jgi:hypothetical protein
MVLESEHDFLYKKFTIGWKGILVVPIINGFGKQKTLKIKVFLWQLCQDAVLPEKT